MKVKCVSKALVRAFRRPASCPGLPSTTIPHRLAHDRVMGGGADAHNNVTLVMLITLEYAR